MNAHIFEDALSFLKQVHALIFQHKNYFKKKTCTFIRTRNDFDNKKNKKYFNIKKSSGISYLIIKNQISTKKILWAIVPLLFNSRKRDVAAMLL